MPSCVYVQLLIPIQGALWSGPANSLSQVCIILLANIFLAYRLVNLFGLLFTLTRYPLRTFRIHGLTKSRIQSLTPIAFSFIAFVFGVVTTTTTTWVAKCVFFIPTDEFQLTPFESSQRYRYAFSVIWYTSQAVAECLITCKSHCSPP